MSTSVIQQKVTDPEFEDSAYSYQKRSSELVDNTFPSSPTISGNNYTFSIAKSGYKAVGIVTCSTNSDMYEGSPCSFNYNNQTVTIYCRVTSSSIPYPRIGATIKYLKL